MANSNYGELLALLWVILFALGSYLAIRTRKNLQPLSQILTVVAASLFLISSITIVAFELGRSDYQAADEPHTVIEVPDVEGTLPDIYYIVLDQYGNDAPFRELFNFDNSEFLDSLRELGFYIASESRINYIPTGHSLASSLNMKLINYLTDEVGEETTDLSPIYEILQNSAVLQFLDAHGYKSIQIGSHWGVTASNPYFDITFSYKPLPEFQRLLYQTTFLRILPDPFDLGIGAPDRLHWKSALYQFDKLAEVLKTKQYYENPLFVFAHIVIPHGPIVFTRDGSFLTQQNAVGKTDIELFIDQLVFTNKKVKNLVDDILVNSVVPPVIVLQGDHGPFTWGFPSLSQFTSEEKTKAVMMILNAYYLPDNGQEFLYDSISPVNTFRVIFNRYFNTDYDLESDRSFQSSNEHPYQFVEVTDILNSN
ncbi:hypothetical protein ACFLXV_03700 [Chloroflexota bacterium]